MIDQGQNQVLDWGMNPIDTLWSLAMLPKFTCATCGYEIDPEWENLDSDEIRLRAQTTYAAQGHDIPFETAEVEYIRYAKGENSKNALSNRISNVIKSMRHEANYLDETTPCPNCRSSERTRILPQE